MSYHWKVNCPVCSFEYDGPELKYRWDGLWVCPDCWEPRNPNDFLRVINDTHPLPYRYKEVEVDVGPDYILPPTLYYCDLYRSQGMADIGVTDCAKTDITL